MAALCANLCLFMIAVVGVVFLRNIFKRSWDTLSWRNLFLLGMVQFYFLSAYFTASGVYTATFHHGTEEAFFTLSLLMPVFFVLFMLSARIAFNRPVLTKLIPQVRMPVTTPSLLVTGGVVLFIAVLFTLIPLYGFFGLLAAQVRGQLAAVAVGLGTYYFVARRFNPLSWAVFLSTLGVGVIAATAGGSGRRHALGVILVLPWIWYWSVWRYRSGAANFVRFSAAAAAGFMAVVLYSPLRANVAGTTERDATFAYRARQLMDLVQNPRIEWDIVKYIIYADTAPNTLFILDNYPSIHPYQPFQGAIWFVTNPIPRFVWPDKPEALGVILQDQMNVPANLGPGIIGHGWAEGGWIGVVAYAVFFGVLVGVIDRAHTERCRNPFFLAVFGSGLGNVIALPRGDTPLFLIQITGGIVVSIALIYLVRTVVGPVVSAFPPVDIAAPGDDTEPDESQHGLSDDDHGPHEGAPLPEPKPEPALTGEPAR